MRLGVSAANVPALYGCCRASTWLHIPEGALSVAEAGQGPQGEEQHRPPAVEMAGTTVDLAAVA